EIAFRKEMGGHGSIPQKHARIASGRRRHVPEELPANLPVNRAGPRTLATAIVDRRVLAEITRNKDRDIGMKERTASQRVVAVKNPVDVLDIESPVVENDGGHSIGIANESRFALPARSAATQRVDTASGIRARFEGLLFDPPSKRR